MSYYYATSVAYLFVGSQRLDHFFMEFARAAGNVHSP